MTILSLGRYGDLIGLIPALRVLPRPRVVVSHEFADLLEGVSYVDVTKYSGGCIELANAAQLCHGMPDLRVAQVFMNPDQRRLTPSYAEEAYRLGGISHLWRKHPLVFDRRSEINERKLLNSVNPDGKPFIAVATSGVSSPFAHGKQVASYLAQRFQKNIIVELDTIRANRVFDLLGILDHAACLVTIDTVHLWLANAAKCPVVALCNDGWMGSPPPVTAIGSLRYSKYQIDQLGDMVESALLPHGGAVGCIDHFGRGKRHQRAARSQEKAFSLLLGTQGIRTAQELGDPRPLPMLKDMMARALKYASGRDVIVWTNDDVEILNLEPVLTHAAKFGACSLRRHDGHVGREMFAFRWDWLADRLYSFPDCAIAAPWFDMAVAAWLRKEAGYISTMDNLMDDYYPCEIPNDGIFHHEDHSSSWVGEKERFPAATWNERIFKGIVKE